MNCSEVGLNIGEMFLRLSKAGALNLEEKEWDTLMIILDKFGAIGEIDSIELPGEESDGKTITDKVWNDYLIVAESSVNFDDGAIVVGGEWKEKKTVVFRSQHDLSGVNWVTVRDEKGNEHKFVRFDRGTGEILT